MAGGYYIDLLISHLYCSDLYLVVMWITVETLNLIPFSKVSYKTPSIDTCMIAHSEHNRIISVERALAERLSTTVEIFSRPKPAQYLILRLSRLAETAALVILALRNLDAFT